MRESLEESWKEFEQTGSVRSYLKYKDAAGAEVREGEGPQCAQPVEEKGGLRG